MALARVVLHQLAHERALRVEHREAGADLLGEREEVELGAEPAMVAPFGLLQTMEVLLEGRLRLPRRPVDALQHRAVLVAPPVRAGDLGELERAEPFRRRDVGTAAEVDELGAVGSRVAVHGDDRALPHLRRVDLLDDVAFVGLVGEQGKAFVAAHLRAHEGLVGLDDLAHPRLDALEVVIREVHAVGQLEVVVEAVLDRRPDRVLRAREEVGDGLGHDVRGRVAQHLAPVGGVGGDDAQRAAVLDGPVEVEPVPGPVLTLPVGEARRDRRLRETRADRGRNVRGRHALSVFPRRAVGQRDRDLVGHRPPDVTSAPSSVPGCYA